MFQNLQAEMARRNLTGRDLAKLLGITEVTLYNKMNGMREWKLNEMEQIKGIMRTDAPYDYLFKR